MTQDTNFATPKYLVEVRKNLFDDYFGDGVADEIAWQEDAGNWIVASETQFDSSTGYVYKQTLTDADYLTYTVDDPTWTDYYVYGVFQIKTSGESAGLVFRKQSTANYYSFKITQGTTDNLKLEKEDGTQIGSLASAIINVNTWYGFRVRVSGTSIACDITTDFFTFTEVISTTDSTYSGGVVGFKTYECEVWFDNLQTYELKKSITEANNEDLIRLSADEIEEHRTGSFSGTIENIDGENKDNFQMGFEIHVWTGYAENSPQLVKNFVGIIEDSKPAFNISSGDVINFSGADYFVELENVPITDVWVGLDSDEIVKDIVAKYIPRLTADLDVEPTGLTITRLASNGQTAREIFEDLGIRGDGAGNQWGTGVNMKKGVVFKQKGDEDSGKTFTVGIDLISHNFGQSILRHKNRIIVFASGKRDENNIVEQLNDNIDEAFGKATTFQLIGQTFELGKGEVFDVVIKPQANAGTPTAGVNIELRTTSGGLPTDDVLSSAFVTLDQWNDAIDDAENITVALDSRVDPTLTYAIVISTNAETLSDTNYMQIAVQNTNDYADGKRVYYNGTTWIDGGDTFDLYFQIYPRLPNIWVEENEPAQKLYGLRILEDREEQDTIRTQQEAIDRAIALKDDRARIFFEGGINVLGAEDIKAGTFATFNIPNSGIVAVPFNIYSITRNIAKTSGFTSTLNLGDRQQATEDVLSDLEERMKAIENKDIDTSQVGIATGFRDDNGNNVSDIQSFSRDINTTNQTWFFGLPPVFDNPIIFGGGDGAYSANEITDVID